MPVLLLLLFSIALSIGMGIIVLLIRRAQGKGSSLERAPAKAAQPGCLLEHSCIFKRPLCWLAIRARSLNEVQKALRLHNAKPCSWAEGLTGDEKLFIAPPVKGWVLVVGTGLPDPGDDVDVCYRFLIELSRKLGTVQFFCANRVLHHHAWVRIEGGKVLRAYAWAGKTLWQQGATTAAEKELNLQCFDYTESSEPPAFGQRDVMALNTDKVPLLAARWSLDPAQIDSQCIQKETGVAGEPSRIY